MNPKSCTFVHKNFKTCRTSEDLLVPLTFCGGTIARSMSHLVCTTFLLNPFGFMRGKTSVYFMLWGFNSDTLLTIAPALAIRP